MRVFKHVLRSSSADKRGVGMASSMASAMIFRMFPPSGTNLCLSSSSEAASCFSSHCSTCSFVGGGQGSPWLLESCDCSTGGGSSISGISSCISCGGGVFPRVTGKGFLFLCELSSSSSDFLSSSLCLCFLSCCL